MCRVCDRVNGYSTAEAAQEAYAAYARSVAEQVRFLLPTQHRRLPTIVHRITSIRMPSLHLQKAQAQLEEEQQEQEEEALGEEEWDASGDGLAGICL